MEIGISLPTMARGYSRASTVEWARIADQGPFSSISCGERMTFHNPEPWITLAAAAAVTERVRILMNLSVLPAHPPALVAKQVATLDVLSEGRVTLAVGVGGREHDYRALDASFQGRHQRLDDHVAMLRSLWRGDPLFEGADPVGPPCVQAGGPPVLAGAMGPKALSRAARWADGVIGFSVGGVPQEMQDAASAARGAWADAGRESPRLVSGCFYALGVPEPADALRSFTAEYLAFAGPSFAEQFAATLTAYDADAVNRALDGAEKAGLDEFVLVPASPDLALLEATMDLVGRR
jgi:alkanesulfonate monooxygenase SsuD/methylene tetrahydromethanopterin reductase-like flavin-dependent oxidoreductase (luciferase family)